MTVRQKTLVALGVACVAVALVVLFTCQTTWSPRIGKGKGTGSPPLLDVVTGKVPSGKYLCFVYATWCGYCTQYKRKVMPKLQVWCAQQGITLVLVLESDKANKTAMEAIAAQMPNGIGFPLFVCVDGSKVSMDTGYSDDVAGRFAQHYE